jgi:hypothetical protein
MADMLTEAPTRENALAMPSGDGSSGLVVASSDMVGSILHLQLRSLSVEGEVASVVLAGFKVVSLVRWQRSRWWTCPWRSEATIAMFMG